MVRNPYVGRVVLKPESGQGDPSGYVLVGDSADLRTILDDLLAAVRRFEGQVGDTTPRFHAVRVGDATSRYEHTYLAVLVDPNVGAHQRRRRRLWQFYDSQLAGLVALVLMLFAIIGAWTVWRWAFGH